MISAMHVTSHDIQTRHEILGHCNCDDGISLQNVVEGMQIPGKACKPEKESEVCIQGKFAQTRKREPDTRAKAPLVLVHTDFAGPVPTESMEGYKYVQSLTIIQVQCLYIF